MTTMIGWSLSFHFDNGYEAVNYPGGKQVTYDVNYNHDGLKVWSRNISFLNDPRFMSAYQRGMNSGHHIMRPAGSDKNIRLEWRAHTCCWAASYAKHLDGDFVECGVNTGILSLAICEYIEINSTGKKFYLFDTYCGLPEDQMSEEEKRDLPASNKEFYSECYDLAVQNFSPFPGARLVRGKVPDTLNDVEIEKVAYLSIDMNLVYPERAAIEHFWPKLVSGGIVVLDDYGWKGHEEQKDAMDAFARSHGLEICTLPTGQGLLIKP